MIKKILFSIIMLIYGCNKSTEPKYEIDEEIYGIWIHHSYQDNLVTFERAEEFEFSKPGYKFKVGDSLVVRLHEGWCATPPITYSNREGTWEIVSESTIEIEAEIYNGLYSTKIFVHDINPDRLTIEYLE